MLRMTLERPGRVLRAGLREIRHRLEQLGLRRATDAPDESRQQTDHGRGYQETPQRIHEDSIFQGDLLSQEDAEIWLEIEDTGDTDAGADHAQTDQVILEVILGEIRGFVPNADRCEDRDRSEGELLQDAGRV